MIRGIVVMSCMVLLVAGCAATQEAKPPAPGPAAPAAVVQPEQIPGNFKLTPQPFPPLDQVRKLAQRSDAPVYGLYIWAGEYKTLRDQLKLVGWKTFRFGGPGDDEIMKMVAEDRVEVMKTLGLRDVDPAGGKKNRADYQADEPFIADYVTGIERFLGRYGPGGTFFKENPGVPNRPVKCVEIWNEPNFQYMIPDREPRAEVEREREALYAKILPAAYRAIKAKWPTVTVIGFGAGGASLGDIRFVRNVFAQSPETIGKSLDVLSTHPYVQPVPPETDSVRSWGSYSVAGGLAQIRDILAKNKVPDKPIWYTELGWPISQADGGHFPTRPGPMATPLLQAAYVVRQYALALRLGVDRVTVMFATDTDNFNAGFFLRDNSWRPSAHAARAMMKLMPCPLLLDAISDGTDGFYAYRFNPNWLVNMPQKPVIMAWNVTGPKTVKIPWTEAGMPAVTDMFGNPLSIGGTGRPTELTLEVGPCPVYVTVAK